jgi:hypothetical protein
MPETAFRAQLVQGDLMSGPFPLPDLQSANDRWQTVKLDDKRQLPGKTKETKARS